MIWRSSKTVKDDAPAAGIPKTGISQTPETKKEKEKEIMAKQNITTGAKFYTQVADVPFVGDTFPKFKAAAVQAAPVFLDREATIDKMAGLVKEAKGNGADLAVFAESFVPSFPHWCLFLPPVDQHQFYKRLFENAVDVPGPAFYRLANIARENKIFLATGITERSTEQFGSLWNSMLMFDREGNLIQHHRKIMPTWGEKLVWAGGDGSSINVHDTELGKIGCLICGENGNQLALNALGAQGEQVHMAMYPATWPTRRQNGVYEDCLRVRTCSQAFQNKMFSICVSAALDEDAIKQMSCGDADTEEWLRNNSYACSMIVGPNGLEISETIKDNKEGIAYADIDTSQCIINKGIHDYWGAYQRFDIFQLHVNKAPQRPAIFHNDECGFSEFIAYEEDKDLNKE